MTTHPISSMTRQDAVRHVASLAASRAGLGEEEKQRFAHDGLNRLRAGASPARAISVVYKLAHTARKRQ